MKYKIEPSIKFIIGSQYFFKGFSDFNSHDTDELWLLQEPLFGKNSSFIFKNQKKHKDIVLYPMFSKEEFIQHDLKKNDRMKFGKYLIPEFVDYIGFTINDLERIKSLMIRLDDNHAYQRTIYNAYIENNSFTLTDEQLNKAYQEYKKVR